MSMKRLKNSLATFACLSALVSLIAVLTPSATRGQGGGVTTKDVNVVNTPEVTVANSPAVRAQQEGAWSVSLKGSPTVRVDESAREPVTIAFDGLEIVPTFIPLYKTETFLIPEGKRLVVEHVYGRVTRDDDQTAPPRFALRYQTVPGSPNPGDTKLFQLSYAPEPTLDAGYVRAFSITQPAKIYASNSARDGKSWGLDLLSYFHGHADDPITLSGYLEPIP